MNSPTSQVVEQAIAKQDAEDAGIVTDDKDKKGGDDDKDSKNGADDKSSGKQGAQRDGKPAGDQDDDRPQYDKDGKRIEKQADDKDKKDDKDKDEGKFTADDALEVDDKPQQPQTPTDAAGIRLSDSEAKYIADNIGEPIVIRGVRGEGDNAKEVEIKAFSPNDIPADFKFANDQQMMAASNGFRNLEQKANDLLGNFRQQQNQTAAQDFERRENEGIRADVADLQKENRFPKFTVQPGAAGFDDSPEAKQMAEVLQVMTERNEMYMRQYNQGRPYKHIGFAEAFDIWEAKDPERQKSRQADEDQRQEDEDRRKRGTERAEQNRGTSPYNIQRPTVKSGTTTRDILARIDADDQIN